MKPVAFFFTEILGLECSKWVDLVSRERVRSTIEPTIHLSEEHSFIDIDASVNNLKSTVLQTQYHIPSAKHPHQVLFWVEFRISVVGIWVLNEANIKL